MHWNIFQCESKTLYYKCIFFLYTCNITLGATQTSKQLNQNIDCLHLFKIIDVYINWDVCILDVINICISQSEDSGAGAAAARCGGGAPQAAGETR